MRKKAISEILTMWLFSVTIIALAGACNDTGIPVGVTISDVEHTLKVDVASNVTFGAQGGTMSMTVYAENVDWQIVGLPTWITTNPMSGSGKADVRLTVEENYDTEKGRQQLFHVTGKISGKSESNTEIPVTVSQERALRYVRAKADNIVFSGSSEVRNIEIEANSDYDVFVTVGSDWLEVSKGDGYVVVSVRENTSMASRSGRISFKTSDQSSYVDVEQRIANVDVSSEPLSFGCEGRSYLVKVSSEVEWRVVCSDSWIDINPADGGTSSDTFFTITALPNQSEKSRNGFVYVFTGDSKRIEIPVEQEGFYFRFVTNDSQEFSSLLFFISKTESFEIETNAGWHVDADSVPEWVSVNPMSGTRSASAKLGVSELYDTVDRSANIKYVADVIKSSKNLLVEQIGRFFMSYDGLHHVESVPSSWTLSIMTNDEWTVRLRPQVDWIKCHDSELVSDKYDYYYYFGFEVLDNPSVNSRHVYMDLCPKYSADTTTIEILQDGRYLNVSEESVTFFAKGGKSNVITVETDGKAAVEVVKGGEWLTAALDTAGLATLTALVNEDDSIRTGIVAFRLTDLIDGEMVRYVNVTQAYSDYNFVKDGYPDDMNLNVGKSGDISITVTGYTNDLNLDELYEMGSGASINVTPYPEETDLNVAVVTSDTAPDD